MNNKILKSVPIRVVLCLIFLLASYVTLFTASSYFNSISASAASSSYIEFENKYGTFDNGVDGASGGETELYADMTALNAEMLGEGTVLLKNEDDFLPITKVDGEAVSSSNPIKMSVLGKNSDHWKYWTYGAGDSSSSVLGTSYSTTGRNESTSAFYTAIDANDKFEMNPTLRAFYADDTLSGETPDFENVVLNDTGIPVGETPISSFYENGESLVVSGTSIENSYKEYDDVAVMVLARVSREGHDAPQYSILNESGAHDDTNMVDGARFYDDHYLQLNADEVATLQMAIQNFDSIVILVNTSSIMELGFLDDPTHYLYTDNGFDSVVDPEVAMARIKSCLQIGLPGQFGAPAILDIMDGTINPSGSMVDTLVRDFKEDPTWGNVGYGEYSTDNYKGQNFIQFDEDIYVGYRYYETRYFEEDSTVVVEPGVTANAERSIDGQRTMGDRDEWYADQVVYPFGYGLSYTSFTQNATIITSNQDGVTLDKDGSILASVEIKNTGNYDGKEPVQVYYSAPYTDAGIQKSHVVLGTFGKSEMITAGGGTDVVNVTFNVEDMKSYDWNDANKNSFKGYELEAGDYYVTVATDSHEAAKQVMAAMDSADGTATNTVKFTLSETIKYDTDMRTGTEVENLFDDVSGTGFTNDLSTGFEGIKQYFMRNDFAGTFPYSQAEKIADDSLLNTQTRVDYEISEEYDAANPWYYGEDDESQATQLQTYDEATIKLWHMAGRDLEDPLWDKLIDQLTMEQIAEICGDCSYSTVAVSNIDKPYTKEQDGPMGIKNTISIQFQSSTVSAQTFNRELVYEQGQLLGYSTRYQKDGVMVGGIYSPVIELHRSPFGGRNMESYSEDPVISGEMCKPYLQAIWEMGVFGTLKHYGLNTTDTDRHSVNIWASEAAIRELYVKPYEICIKDGYTVAMMNSNSFLGGFDTVHNWGLNTGLTRNEWGFEGFIVTDMTPEDTNMLVRAGTDMNLTGTGNSDPSTDPDDCTTTHVHAVRQAAKNVLYVVANSHSMQGYGGAGLDNIAYSASTKLNVVSGQSTSLDIDGATAILDGTDYNGYTYELSSGESLPTGLTLNEDGTITGVTSEIGTHSVKITVGEDQEGGSTINHLAHEEVVIPYNDIEVEFTFTVYDSSNLPTDVIYNTTTLPDIAVGYSYTTNIASAIYFENSSVVSSGITYELEAGNSLPNGLSLTDGVISGVCTEVPGNYYFSVVASAPGEDDVTANFFVEVVQYAIDYEAKKLDDISVGDTISYDIGDAVSQQGQNIVYSLKSGDSLPDGMSLSSTGVISGTATKATTNHIFTIVATTSNTPTVEVAFSMTVQGLVAENQTFSGLLYGKDYGLAIEVSATEMIDGVAVADEALNYTVSLKSGSTLPTGFTLVSDGTLVGNTKNVGTVSFVVVVEAYGYASTECTITLVIEDHETDTPLGSADEPVDFDNLYEEYVIEGGCSGSIIDNGIPFVFAGLLGFAIYMVIVNKKKSSNK